MKLIARAISRLWKYRWGIAGVGAAAVGGTTYVTVSNYVNGKGAIISFTLQGMLACFLTLQWRRFAWLWAQAKHETAWQSSFFLEGKNGFGMHLPQQRWTTASGGVPGDGGTMAVYSCYFLSWIDRIYWDVYCRVRPFHANAKAYYANIASKAYNSDPTYAPTLTNIYRNHTPVSVKIAMYTFVLMMVGLFLLLKKKRRTKRRR